MKGGFGAELPKQLRGLDFLVGDSSGPGILHPPDRAPVPFVGHLHVERESCDRFLRMEFFTHLPMFGMESMHSVLTYSEKNGCYQMWSFAASQEDPISLSGHFEGSSLVFVSDPTEMVWGLQRLRCTFKPLGDCILNYCVELWTIDGYTPYFQGTYTNASVQVG